MKLLEGYVKNRTREAALAAVFGALFLIVRTIRVPILPPLIIVDFSICFWSSAVLFLSYFYLWVFALLMSITSTLPPSIIGTLVGMHIIYFLNKLIGRKGIYLCFFASIFNGIANTFILNYLKIINLWPIFPTLMVKMIIQGIGAVILVPIIFNFLERFNVIEGWSSGVMASG